MLPAYSAAALQRSASQGSAAAGGTGTAGGAHQSNVPHGHGNAQAHALDDGSQDDEALRHVGSNDHDDEEGEGGSHGGSGSGSASSGHAARPDTAHGGRPATAGGGSASGAYGGHDADGSAMAHGTGTAASDIPLDPAAAEAQRKAAQRERELAARARLKAIVAADGFDGRASVDFYGFGKVLGTGSFGEVRLAWHRLAGVKVAIKSYEKSRITDASQWKRVQQEVEVLQRLNHPHVLRMFETIDTPKRIHIATEFCSGGNLCTYVKGKGRLSEAEARRIFTQLLAGIEYLHAQGIVHRDIKLENVLFADEKQDSVKLVDFGFAVLVADPWRRLRVFCGTPSYMAPEICQRREYLGRPVDVWSLGVLLYAMLVGRFPFAGKTYPDLYKRIIAGQINFPDHLSPSSRDLLRRMLTVDPARRLSMPHVETHPWVLSGSVGSPTASAPGPGGLFASGGAGPPSPISAAPPILAPDKSILVSADPSNDMNEAVMQRCEQLGFRRQQVLSAILARARDACTTTYYLLITRMGRSAKVPPPPSTSAAGGAGASGGGRPSTVGVGLGIGGLPAPSLSSAPHPRSRSSRHGLLEEVDRYATGQHGDGGDDSRPSSLEEGGPDSARRDHEGDDGRAASTPARGRAGLPRPGSAMQSNKRGGGHAYADSGHEGGGGGGVGGLDTTTTDAGDDFADGGFGSPDPSMSATPARNRRPTTAAIGRWTAGSPSGPASLARAASAGPLMRRAGMDDADGGAGGMGIGSRSHSHAGGMGTGTGMMSEDGGTIGAQDATFLSSGPAVPTSRTGDSHFVGADTTDGSDIDLLDGVDGAGGAAGARSASHRPSTATPGRSR